MMIQTYIHKAYCICPNCQTGTGTVPLQRATAEDIAGVLTNRTGNNSSYDFRVTVVATTSGPDATTAVESVTVTLQLPDDHPRVHELARLTWTLPAPALPAPAFNTN